VERRASPPVDCGGPLAAAHGCTAPDATHYNQAWTQASSAPLAENGTRLRWMNPPAPSKAM